jgi:uncharacterized protein (DUF58 family)
MTKGFQYEITWPPPGHHPGHHKSSYAGGGLEFRGHAPFASAPDARRIDLRASLKDPLGQWIVRTYRQRSAIALYIVADLTGSMGVSGAYRKLEVLADFTDSAAYSAYRTGDAFGFLGADEHPRKDFFLPATRSVGASLALSAKLRAFEPTGSSAQGLLRAASWLPSRRCLVFLVSDFHFPLLLLKATLDAFGRHEVIPVVLWEHVDFAPARRFGIAVLRDAESGHRRTLLLRPALQRKLASAFHQRYESLRQLFAKRGMRPLLMTGRFHAEQLTRYFAGAPPVPLPAPR